MAYAPRPAGLGWVRGTPAQFFQKLGFQKGFLCIFGVKRGESIIDIEVYYADMVRESPVQILKKNGVPEGVLCIFGVIKFYVKIK